jgi:hypothetical protein
VNDCRNVGRFSEGKHISPPAPFKSKRQSSYMLDDGPAQAETDTSSFSTPAFPPRCPVPFHDSERSPPKVDALTTHLDPWANTC